MITKSPEMLRTLGSSIMQAAGATQPVAECVTDHLVSANLVGIDSHGFMRLPDYAGWLVDGKAAADDRMEMVNDGGATCLIDANYTYGAVAATKACAMAIEKSRELGAGLISVRNATHIGRLGHYAEDLADAGHIGFICCHARGAGQFVAPWGGREPRLTTNPLAWGFPSGRDAGALVMDMSTSAAPEGKIRLAQRRGEAIPPGIVIDADGQTTTDPAALHGSPPGAILPFGEHKGYVLALAVEALAGALSGGGVSRPVDEVYTHGCNFFLMAARVDAFLPRAQFEQELDAMLDYVKTSAPINPDEPVRVPYELESRLRCRRSSDGITIDDASWQRVVDLAGNLDLEIE
tara:strand:+ start:1281 stop:2327 length:1047 start_codon:yes stop_codon:yes gene_type:complete